MTYDVDKPSPGDLARAVKDIALVKALVARGADVSENIGPCDNPVMAAAQRGTPEVMRFLLEKGGRTDHVDDNEMTPLHHAAMSGRLEIVKLLLGFGAEIEARDQDGMTPLIRAAQFGHIDTVQVLLERGAFLETRDKGFGTARSRAEGWGQAELVELFRMPVDEWPRYRLNKSAREDFNAGHGAVVERQRQLRRLAPKPRPVRGRTP